MTQYRRKFQCKVLTPRGGVCDVEAVSVVFPAVDGQVGILGGHLPLVATMGAGPLVIEESDGTLHVFFVAGGFSQVLPDAMVILADRCQRGSELNVESALQELEQAQELPGDRRAALSAARAKLALAKTLAATGEGQPAEKPAEA